MSRYGKLIEEARREQRLSRRRVAKKAGVSEAYVRFIEKGERPASLKTLRKIASILQIDEREILEAWLQEHMEGVNLAPEGLRKVLLISWVKAGEFALAEDPYAIGDSEDWIWTQAKGPNVFALKVQGDSMEPEFREGEIIILPPHIAWEVGSYVIVKNGEGEATFKQLKKKGNMWVLHLLNPRYEDIAVDNRQLYVVGVVVEKLKRY